MSEPGGKKTKRGKRPTPAPVDAAPVEGVPTDVSSAASSGSVDISMSNLTSVRTSDPSIASTSITAVSDGTPAAVGETASAPIASGKVSVAHAASDHTTRTRRITEAAKERFGASVELLGEGLGTLGEGVAKLGEKSRKVPLVGELTGSSVTKLGAGLTQVGSSIGAMPRVAATRRGRLLVRSLFVGFVLIAAWISIIVALQLRSNETPDFRPIAEKILVDLNSGTASIEELYDRSSPRFQEMVRRERFVDDMNDLLATVGPFREITAVNDTLVTTGPTGKVGRVSLTIAYEKATCKGSVSLHYDKGAWKLLGIGVELPPELEITQAQREERVQACKDPMAKDCDLNVAANAILEQLRDGQAPAVWDGATRVFQNQEEKARWVEIQAEHAGILGRYSRILSVTEARVYGGTSATFDAILEFERANGVRAVFGFYRRGKTVPWKLRSYKIVLPMPRAGEREATTSPADVPKSGGLIGDDDDDEPVGNSTGPLPASEGGSRTGGGSGRGTAPRANGSASSSGSAAAPGATRAPR
ncbi:MAG: hypothetical protein SFX73_40745 [Kofleriaceae bacterium]|nr:hypothetical protein [Kofleriaceae bacterium]